MRTDFYPCWLKDKSYTIVPRVQIATSTHAHGESDEKKRQVGVNKYRAQKIASSTPARGDGGIRWRCDYKDRQTVNLLTDLAQNFIRTYIHDDKTVY
ncbi:hypothetical protein AVEN_163793-1 [Araneus ventricosus]|uniref:Uncharacterized protein n=1 Tax=Araneus ventricosus TaxID=182803 RepID=A0A4Y2TAX6_ARAVE|nr:hypothetical protein AVEN_27663-1 [Araneus ventricosus]GBN96549.1 hypothetical protein AVEN_163793-1 [Araneus ventricosus]